MIDGQLLICHRQTLALDTVIHRYLKLTEVSLLLSVVPTLDFCLGEQHSSRAQITENVF